MHLPAEDTAPAAAEPRQARHCSARRGPHAWSEKPHCPECQRSRFPKASGPPPGQHVPALRRGGPGPGALKVIALHRRRADESRSKDGRCPPSSFFDPPDRLQPFIFAALMQVQSVGRAFFGEAGLDGLERSGANRLVGEARLALLDDAEALDQATRARDRAAVRALIARRPPPERQTRVSREFDQEDFHCPVCRELLWKPVIKQCGHAACFLCTHKAMDQLCDSACPLCRAPFRHLGDVCEPLHNFMPDLSNEETGGALLLSDVWSTLVPFMSATAATSYVRTVGTDCAWG